MEEEWLLLVVWQQEAVGNISQSHFSGFEKREGIMDFIAYLISGFLIVKFYFAKSKIQKLFFGFSCLVVSLIIRYQAIREFDLGMFFHVFGAFLILIALNYVSKIKIR